MLNELDKILIKYYQPKFADKLKRLRNKLMLAARFEGYFSKGNRIVVQILREVANNGYTAVRKYTRKFDKVDIPYKRFHVSINELKRARDKIIKSNPNLIKAIRFAIKNVRDYQEAIFRGHNKQFLKGAGIRYTPIKRIGIYIPGGAAPLPSTVIMTAVPAQVAGVKDIVVVSPPIYNKDIHPVILGVCYELGINEVYRVGGAQGIAVLASSKTILKVDKIVGPGNKWVQSAKNKVCNTYVGIDSIAGPSEVLIIANDKANPAYVAADMLSQAEHGPGSATVFTDSKSFAEKVLEELKKQVENLFRKDITIKCLKKFSFIAVFENMKIIIKTTDEFASEHLEIQCGDESKSIAEKIENAGAIFIGDYSPVAVGDYWAGPSHTLPTGMTAKFSSALTSNDFVKSISIIKYDKKKLAESADDIIRLAEAEGLDAHAKSVKIRLER